MPVMNQAQIDHLFYLALDDVSVADEAIWFDQIRLLENTIRVLEHRPKCLGPKYRARAEELKARLIKLTGL